MYWSAWGVGLEPAGATNGGGLAGCGGRVGEALQTNKLGVGSSCHASRFEEAHRRDSHGEGFRGECIVV